MLFVNVKIKLYCERETEMNKKGLHEYKKLENKSDKAEWVYTGAYYRLFCSDKELKKLKLIFILTSIVNIVVTILIGFIDTNSLRTLYVVIPFVMVLFFVFRILQKRCLWRKCVSANNF
jgi:hypothetical protein